MTIHDQPKSRASPPRALNHEFHTMLDTLLALDRAVVEVSMLMYNVPSHERLIIRQQNRRLHDGVRERLPRPSDWPPESLPDAP